MLVVAAMKSPGRTSRLPNPADPDSTRGIRSIFAYPLMAFTASANAAFSSAVSGFDCAIGLSMRSNTLTALTFFSVSTSSGPGNGRNDVTCTTPTFRPISARM